MDADDFDHLPSDLTRTWFLNDNGEGRGYEYVRAGAAGASGHLVTIARVILGAGRGEAVRSISGDRCDLRRRNLTISRAKHAKRDDRRQVGSGRGAFMAAASASIA